MVLAVGFETLRDLGRQFAGGFQDQRAGHAGSGPARGQYFDHGQGETGGLAGAGLGAAKDIAAHQRHRNGLGLNRGRLAIAGLVDGAKDVGAKPQFSKTHSIPFIGKM